MVNFVVAMHDQNALWLVEIAEYILVQYKNIPIQYVAKVVQPQILFIQNFNLPNQLQYIFYHPK